MTGYGSQLLEQRTLLDAALVYAARGTAVFPCAPRTKRPASAHGFHDATTDVAMVERWWWQTPDANIGAPTGITFDVVDFDTRVAYEEIHRDHGLRGPQVRTGRGAHLHIAPTGRHSTKLAPDIDFKGAGGYVLLPPSVHPSGAVYTWVERGGPGCAPGWLYDLFAQQNSYKPVDNVRRRSRPTPRSVASLRSMAERLAHESEGNRNAFLFWAACAAADTGATVDQVEIVLTDGALRAGLDEREITRTLASAFARWT